MTMLVPFSPEWRRRFPMLTYCARIMLFGGIVGFVLGYIWGRF